MAINLTSRFEKPLEKEYIQGSYTRPYRGTRFKKMEGVDAIETRELVTDALKDYNLSGGTARAGAYTDVQDIKRVYSISQKKCFNKFFDRVHIEESEFIRQAPEYMHDMVQRQYLPLLDEYTFTAWANGAGLGKLNATQLTKSTITEAILKAGAEMDDAGVPREGRVCFIRSDIAVATRLASELAYNANWTNQGVVKGKITEIDGMDVISVPKPRFPAGCEFMLKHKDATADPEQYVYTTAIEDPDGNFGVQMKGLFIYDAFVLGSMCNGVYAYFESDACDAVTASIASNSVTLACATSGATIKYTTDGSDPKTNSSASTYSSAVAITADTKFRAYASMSGLANGPVLEYDATYTA